MILPNMNIGLIGYGKMGKMVERLALERGHKVVSIVSRDSSFLPLSHADVCIEFSNPECVIENLRKVAALGKNLVIGTTGWFDQLDKVREIVEESGIGFLYAPNFSVGMNLFLSVVNETVKIMKDFPQYDIAGVEEHHSQKKDAPSGTALQIADNVRRQLGHEIDFTSLRYGSIPGTHSLHFDSPADTITLTHQARNREGFAEGAVIAAEWLQGKTGFFTFEEALTACTN